MNKILIYELLFCLIPLSAFSQDRIIKSVVLSDKKEPIEFANIVLCDTNLRFLGGTVETLNITSRRTNTIDLYTCHSTNYTFHRLKEYEGKETRNSERNRLNLF